MSLPELENTLHHLNYRWNLESLALWRGEKGPFEPHDIYKDYEDFLNLHTLAQINKLKPIATRTRLKHATINHYLQRALLPHETEMRSWMMGAAAHVNGQKIYLRDVIPWCQKSSTHEERRILEKEIRSLCRFLKPFALNYWEVLLRILKEDLGYKNYIDYCQEKKGLDFSSYCETLREILRDTDDLYFAAMERWARRRFALPLEQLSRFDAIMLTGLGEYDAIFPRKSIKELAGFFRYWEMDIENIPGLHLELEWKEGKSSQAMCFLLEVPEEVYILMKPEGGWIDLETLWHELGHGLSAVFTSPELGMVERDMATSFSLSESFAFLLQHMTISKPFLEDFMGVSPQDAQELAYHKVLKDFYGFRRYAAKFLVEFEMFSNGEISNGMRYAQMLKRFTGFYYQPESHLFDLTPEFYCLDYLLGWMAEAVMEAHLRARMGTGWMFDSGTSDLLRAWWAEGNRYDIFQFLKRNDLKPLSADALLQRWRTVLL